MARQKRNRFSGAHSNKARSHERKECNSEKNHKNKSRFKSEREGGNKRDC